MGHNDYCESAMEDARSMAHHFVDEMAEMVIYQGQASLDLANDYSGGDSYVHERFQDHISPTQEEANEILDQLSDHVETDSGIWQGEEPQQAIISQAVYTYGNAVTHYWREIVEEINADEVLQAIQTIQGHGDYDLGPITESVLSSIIDDAL